MYQGRVTHWACNMRSAQIRVHFCMSEVVAGMQALRLLGRVAQLLREVEPIVESYAHWGLLDGHRYRLRLHLKRPHVAHRAARFWAWVAALVLRQIAVHFRNVVDGNASLTKRVRHGRSAVIGKLVEV